MDGRRQRHRNEMTSGTRRDHNGTSVWIRPTWSKANKPPKRRRHKGRYVYAWFNADSPLPFYIGKGSDSRAWDRHADKNGRAMWCQTTRVASEGFRVEVIRDNLTDEGAMLLESALIAFTQLLGGTLCNQSSGLSRNEEPPLEIDGCLQHPQAAQDCA
jgi:hypothetical protein